MEQEKPKTWLRKILGIIITAIIMVIVDLS